MGQRGQRAGRHLLGIHPRSRWCPQSKARAARGGRSSDEAGAGRGCAAPTPALTSCLTASQPERRVCPDSLRATGRPPRSSPPGPDAAPGLGDRPVKVPPPSVSSFLSTQCPRTSLPTHSRHQNVLLPGGGGGPGSQLLPLCAGDCHPRARGCQPGTGDKSGPSRERPGVTWGSRHTHDVPPTDPGWAFLEEPGAKSPRGLGVACPHIPGLSLAARFWVTPVRHEGLRPSRRTGASGRGSVGSGPLPSWHQPDTMSYDLADCTLDPAHPRHVPSGGLQEPQTSGAVELGPCPAWA